MKLRCSSALFAWALGSATSLAASPLLWYPDGDDERMRCIDTAFALGCSAPAPAVTIPNAFALEPGYWSIDPGVVPKALSFPRGNGGEANLLWAPAAVPAVDLESPAAGVPDPPTVFASDIPPAEMAFGFLLICILAREPLHRRKRRSG